MATQVRRASAEAAPVDVAGAPLQHVSFMAAGEQYAVSLLEVREIVQYSPVTRIPGVAPFIHGVTNLRGKVVPVLDLAVRFGLAPSTLGARSCVVMLDVLLDGEPAVLGLLVDTMSRILELREGDIEPPPTFGTVAGAGFLRGMAKEDSKFVLILDVNQLVSGELIHLPSLIAEPADEAAGERKRRRSKRARKREPEAETAAPSAVEATPDEPPERPEDPPPTPEEPST